jgi:intracellular multiplication protein IcmP
MPTPQGQTQTPENSLDFLWGIVLIVGIVLVGWYFGKSYIGAAVFYVKLGEIAAIKFVLSFWDKLAAFLHLPPANLDALDKWISVIKKPAGPITFKTLAQVNTDVGKFTRYPIALILVLLAASLYFRSVAIKFKNVFTMEKLRDVEKVNWPRIMPVVNLKLIDKDINKGPWAMSMTPMQFCKKNNLLKEENNNGKPAVSLLRGKAYDVFALQLGPLWHGHIDALPIHMQALLAIFAARADKDVLVADKLLDQIAGSAANGKLDFSGTRELLRKHINAKPVVKVMSRHAYVSTMMASMLRLARTAGVIASADFIWLKPKDRKLWYILNSIGRQNAVAEVAGVFAHWLVEDKLNYPMKTPMVESAVNGLEEALNEVLYEPEED